jgi:hypothetical protein
MIEIIGGCTRTRTLDPLIKSQLLYQLSYAPDAGAPYTKALSVCRELPWNAAVRLNLGGYGA